jgi:hypothetical protein
MLQMARVCVWLRNACVRCFGEQLQLATTTTTTLEKLPQVRARNVVKHSVETWLVRSEIILGTSSG